MHRLDTEPSRCSAFSMIVALAALDVAMMCNVGAAWAEELPRPRTAYAVVSSMKLADLEDAFWVCDFVATKHGVAKTDTDACGTICSGLKGRKFGWDFAELLRWWKENKAARHERLDDVDDRPLIPGRTRGGLGAT
jgi:hypothetical protein